MLGIIKVEQGKALVVSNVASGLIKVSFTGGLIIPVVNKAEIMDISVQTIEIEHADSDGLLCRDDVRVDITVSFFVRVNRTEQDVIKVAQSIGCDRASDPRMLKKLFSADFSDALRTACRELDFIDLDTKRREFRARVREILGTDLKGYCLDDCTVDHLERTPET